MRLGLRPNRRRLERETIAAATSKDFDTLLDSLQVTRDMRRGRVHCKFCARTLQSVGEVGIVFPESGAIHVVCDDPNCTLQFARYIGEHPELY